MAGGDITPACAICARSFTTSTCASTSACFTASSTAHAVWASDDGVGRTGSANSPQAKGRIERLFVTLQDRLVSELRLAGISTLEEANRFLEGFLERYNARFAVPPEQSGSAYRSAQALETETPFCFKYERMVGADNVVRFGGRRLQILPSLDRISYARCSVQVHEQLDGTLKVYYRENYLDTRSAPPEATKARALVSTSAKAAPPRPRQVTKPALDHPWRRWVYRADRE